MQWTGAAVAATAVATIAIAASVGASRNVLSADDVARQLAADPANPAPGEMVVGPSATPAPIAPGENVKYVASRAGTIVVQCSGNTVTLRSWTPKPDYRVDEVVRGPDVKAAVWFESDTFDDVEVVVKCVDGQPQKWEFVEGDDHGGGSGGGGPGGGGPNPGSGGGAGSG
jgi:hypothetical protein